MNKTTSMLF